MHSSGFNFEETSHRLMRMTTAGRQLFALGCVERMVTTLSALPEIARRRAVVSAILEGRGLLVTSLLQRGEGVRDRAMRSADALERLIDESEEPPLIADTLAVLVYALRLVADGDQRQAGWVAQRTISYVEEQAVAFVEAGGASVTRENSECIDGFPSVQAELARQERDLELYAIAQWPSQEEVDRVTDRGKAEAVPAPISSLPRAQEAVRSRS